MMGGGASGGGMGGMLGGMAKSLGLDPKGEVWGIWGEVRLMEVA